jgi:hypothetical protein
VGYDVQVVIDQEVSLRGYWGTRPLYLSYMMGETFKRAVERGWH